MKFLVMSDTHGNYPLALRAEELAGDIDAIIHLGDGVNDAILLSQALDIEVIMVAGNCDLGVAAPREMLWECEGYRILLVHGDRYGVKYNLERLKLRSLEVKADIVLYGHTHIASITKTSDILFINPGTLIKSNQYKSFAILALDIDGATARIQGIPKTMS